MRSRQQVVSFVSCIVFVLSFVSVSAGSLVDRYEFEGDGVDSQGGNANGTVGANVSFTTGKIGQAATFPASFATTADRIVVPAASAFDPGTGDFSIAFWINPPTIGSTRGILDTLATSTVGYQAFVLNTGFVRYRLDDNGGNTVNVDSMTQVVSNTFQNVVLTVNRTSDEAIFYFDGVAEAAVDISALTGAISPSQNLLIGGEFASLLGLNGALDDLRFYDNALSQAEVQALIPTAPEPSTFVLCAVALLGLTCSRRRSKVVRR